MSLRTQTLSSEYVLRVNGEFHTPNSSNHCHQQAPESNFSKVNRVNTHTYSEDCERRGILRGRLEILININIDTKAFSALKDLMNVVIAVS